MGELPFVGADRQALVERLVAEFDLACIPGAPARLVTLEAPSGWGKTRLVHELYRALARRQGSPAYWPASIVEASARPEEATLDARKVTYPQRFVAPRDATPEWFWWGLTATARQAGASAVQAIADDLTQIEAHRSALERRWRQVTGRREQIADAVGRRRGEVTDEVAGDLTGEVLGRGLEQLLNVSVPGLGLLWWAGQTGWQQRDRWRARRPPDQTVDAMGADREDLVELLATEVVRFAASGIPIVIVVEDLHSADASLVTFLQRLLTSRPAPVLVVATAWPGTLDERHRHATDLVRAVPMQSTARLAAAELTPLSSTDVAHLAELLLPDADDVGRAAATARFTNPLALQVALGLPRVQRASRRGRLADALTELPNDVRSLYRVMWDELPNDLREAIALAVLGSLSNIGSLFDARVWDADLTSTAAADAGWVDADAGALRRRLGDEGEAYAWVQRLDQWLQMCPEAAQHDVATETATDLCTEEERREFLTALAAAIDLGAELDDGRRSSHARLLVALAADGIIEWTDQVVEAADLLIAEYAGASDVDSLRTLAAVASSVPSHGDTPAELQRRHVLARASIRLGQLAAAAQELDRLLERRTRVVGPDHPDTIAVRHDLANVIGQRGGGPQAVEGLEGVVDVLTRTVGVDQPATLSARNDLAAWLGRVGRTDDAIAQFTQLLDDRTRILGPDHPRTLITRSNLASWLAKAGRTDDAIAQFTQLLDDRTRILGPDHPRTLITRSNLARWLREAGHLDVALERFTRLLEDRIRILGPDHPRTLGTRSQIAECLHQAGRAHEAIERLEQLLMDRTRVLGADAPDTQATRDDLERARAVPDAGWT